MADNRTLELRIFKVGREHANARVHAQDVRQAIPDQWIKATHYDSYGLLSHMSINALDIRASPSGFLPSALRRAFAPHVAIHAILGEHGQGAGSHARAPYQTKALSTKALWTDRYTASNMHG